MRRSRPMRDGIDSDVGLWLATKEYMSPRSSVITARDRSPANADRETRYGCAGSDEVCIRLPKPLHGELHLHDHDRLSRAYGPCVRENGRFPDTGTKTGAARRNKHMKCPATLTGDHGMSDRSRNEFRDTNRCWSATAASPPTTRRSTSNATRSPKTVATRYSKTPLAPPLSDRTSRRCIPQGHRI